MNGTLIHYINQKKHFLEISFDCFITLNNVFNTNSCIDIDSFSITSESAVLVTIYIVTNNFVDMVQKHFIFGMFCGKSTTNLTAQLLRLCFSE